MRWRRLFGKEAPADGLHRRLDPLARVPRDDGGLPDVDAIGRHYGLPPELRRRVVGSARRSYKVEPGAAGASRLGGTPDLPPSSVWPEYRGVPMTFFAQVRVDYPPLEPAASLPAGMLQFFWDEAYHDETDERGWCRVLHHDSSAPLERRPTPPGTRAEVDGYARDGEYDEVPARVEPWLSLDPALLDVVDDDSFDAVAETVGAVNGGHRLLGYAAPIQGPPEAEAESYLPADAAPVLLLQLDCTPPFESAGALGDAGAVYFLLPGDDLARGRFDRAVAIMQCH